MKDFTKATITIGEGLGATDYIFKKWEKGGKSRVYVSYRGLRDCGYIDLVDGSNHVINNAYAQEAVEKFANEYLK